MSSSFLTNECSHIFGLCLQRHSRVGNSSPHSGLLGQLKQRTAEPQHIHQNQNDLCGMKNQLLVSSQKILDTA